VQISEAACDTFHHKAEFANLCIFHLPNYATDFNEIWCTVKL